MQKNELKFGVVLSYLNTGLSMIVSLVYTPVMLRLLGQSQYGVYQTAASVISYLGLLSLGFGSSYMRFFARYNAKKDGNGIKKLNGLYLSFYCIVACVALIAGFTLAQFPEAVFGSKFTADETLLAQKLMYPLVCGVALSFVNSVFYSYIAAKEKFIFINLLNILSTIVSPCVTLLFLIAGYGAIGLTVVSVAVNAICFVCNVVYAVKTGFEVSFGISDGKLFGEIFVFASFILISTFAGQINATIDKFLLARYIGSSSVAVYEIGSKFNAYLMSFSLTVSSVFTPRINNYVAEGRSDRELSELMTRVGRIQFYIMTLVFGGFILVGRYFIGIYAGDGYEQSYFIALYLMGASLIPYCQNIGIEIQKAKNKHMFRSVAYLIIALCNIAVSIPLIKTMGISGAALGSALALIVGNGIIMNIYYKKGIGLDMGYFWRELFRPVIAAVAAFVPCFAVSLFWQVDRISRFITVGAAYVLLFCGAVWLIGANSYEKGLVKDIFDRIFKKLGKTKNKTE